jgi:vacuolar-type H+-ATPase subunit C/Vma6
MNRTPRLDYAYAVGRVRTLENWLISRAVFEEASAARTQVDAMKTIVDAGRFLEERVEFQNPLDLDGYLEEERRWFLEDIQSLFLEKVYWRIFQSHHAPQEMLEMAQDLDCPFVRHYIRHLLDLKNLKLFLRARYLELPLDRVASRFLQGGTIEVVKFTSFFAVTNTEFADLLHATPYRDFWERTVDTLTEHNSFRDLERGSEDFLMRYLRQAKNIVFGPEPVFAYALARLRELALVRMVGVGKLLQIPPDVLTPRISETYV